MKVVFTPEAERDIERLAYIKVVSDYLESEYDKAHFDYKGNVWCIKSNGKWGLADFYGEELFPPRYDWMGDGFYDGLCLAGYRGENPGVGYINLKGEEVIAPKRWSVTDFAPLVFHCVGSAIYAYQSGIGYFADLRLLRLTPFPWNPRHREREHCHYGNTKQKENDV